MNNIADKIMLSVIIPAYNEARRIEKTLESIQGYFKTKDISHEIIVVDDGSRDGTLDVVRAYAEKLPAIRILENRENRGKGYSVNHGMREACGEYQLFMDADNAIDISHLDVFLQWMKKGYHVAVGSLCVEDAMAKQDNGYHRKVLSALSKILIRTLTRIPIQDTQRAFKLFSRAAAEAIFPKQTVGRYGFDIEILVIAHTLGFKIKELPVTWLNPSGSKVTPSAYIHTFWELLRIVWNQIIGKYTLTPFGGKELLYEKTI